MAPIEHAIKTNFFSKIIIIIWFVTLVVHYLNTNNLRHVSTNLSTNLLTYNGYMR